MKFPDKAMSYILAGINTTEALSKTLNVTFEKIESLAANEHFLPPLNKEASRYPGIPEYKDLIPENREWGLTDRGFQYVQVNRISPNIKALAKIGELSKPIRQTDSKSEKNRFQNRFQIGSGEEPISGIMEKLKDPNLIFSIAAELNKGHIGDNREKMLTYLCFLGGMLPPEYRKGLKVGGSSATGKDNAIRTVRDLFPEDYCRRITQSSNKALQRQLEDLPEVIYFSEVNMKQKGGANINILEILKALMEDGADYEFLAPEGNDYTPVRLSSDRKTCVYSTTDVGGDDELLNRVLVIVIKGGIEQTREVIKTDAKKSSSIDKVIEDLKNKPHESWVSEIIPHLDIPHAIVFPYLEKLAKYTDVNQLRARRDWKTLKSITAWIAFLYQKQRKFEEREGFKILISEPIDLFYALTLASKHLNQSYHGLEPRLKATVKKIQDLSNEDGWVPMGEIRQVLKFNKKVSWGVFDELDNLNVIERRSSPQDKRRVDVRLVGKGEIPFFSKNNREILEEIVGKQAAGNLSKPIETYLETYFSESESVARESKSMVKNEIGSIGSITLENKIKEYYDNPAGETLEIIQESPEIQETDLFSQLQGKHGNLTRTKFDDIISRLKTQGLIFEASPGRLKGV